MLGQVKKSAILFLGAILLSASQLAAQQVVLSDDFEDENLTQNPEWSGDLNHFTFFDEGDGNTLLRLDADSGDRSEIVTLSSTAYGSWEFFIKVPTTSPQNRAYIYLISDSNILDIVGGTSPGNANGYAIHTGGGSFDLVRLDNGNATVILSSDTEITGGQGYQIRIVRSEDNEWQLYIGEEYGSTPQLDSEMVVDGSHTESEYFGIYFRYSSGNSNNFYFDDIRITASEISVLSTQVISATEIDITFTNNIDENSLNNTDFVVNNGVGNPENVSLESSNRVRLTFSSAFFDGDYTVTINDLEDVFGQVIEPNTEAEFTISNPFFVTDFEAISRSEFEITFSEDVQSVAIENFEIPGFGSPSNVQISADVVQLFYANPVDVGNREIIINSITSEQGWEIEANTTVEFALFDPYEAGDLVISEFFYRTPTSWRTADFDRPQYVEIYNRSDKVLNLRNYTLSGNNISENKNLPIDSGEYLVIARGTPVFESRFGNRNFVEADHFPALNLTTSGTIELATNEGDLVETLTYTASTWGGNGVALERFDMDVSAEYRDNWAESEDVLAGSPGLPNTIHAPVDSPEVVAAEFPSPFILQITFLRTLSDASMELLSAYSLNNGADLISVQVSAENERILEFEVNNRLEDQFEYTFSYSGIEDIFGNEASGTFSFTFQNPFRILAAEVEGDSDLLLHFTLPVDVNTVPAAHFELADGTTPDTQTADHSETIRLTFSEAFETGRFEVTVNGLETFVPGLPDQWRLEANSSAEFFRFDEYQPGDFVLNEFMYRPPSGYPKYVEIKNTSNRFLSLKNFELRRAEGASSNGGEISEFDVPVEPGGFAVITENSSLLEEIFGSGPWLQMNGFPGYTLTTADQIRFLDPEENLVESIHYNPSTWGGNGVALERRSTEAAANSINNWGESQANLLGTPGEENTVSPDEQGPQFLFAEFIDGETVQVTFSGALDPNQIDASNFSINRGLSVTEVQFIGEGVLELSLNQGMNSGTSYTITATQIPDIFGNVLSNAQQTFTYYFVQEAEPGDVLISEFMYNAPESYSEYIELYNHSDKVIDLHGWQQANDTGTRRVVVDQPYFLTPGSYVVLLRNLSLLDFFPDIPFIEAGSSLSALKNGGDDIVITTAQNITVDSLRYDSSWGGSRVSLERRDFNVPSTSRGNWAESLDPRFGTPGRANSVSADEDGPELVSANFVNERTIEVMFAGAIDRSAISAGNFTISGGRSIREVAFTSNVNALLTLDGAMNSGTRYTLAVQNIRDIFGNTLNSAQTEFIYYQIQIAEPGDVVINEFMYNPPEEYTRYIELYNRSDKAVDLAGWQQANDTGTRRVLTTGRVILPPGAYMVVLPNFNLLSQFPDIPAINAGTAFAALKTGGDNIVITNAENVVIDSLTYRPSWGGNGVALERRRADRSSLYAENWAESPNEKFGTPGRANEVERNFELIATRIEALNREEVEIEFNVPVRQGDLATGNFQINGMRPQQIATAGESIVRLRFSPPLPTGGQTMHIRHVRSRGGFEIADNYQIPFTVYDPYEDGDILVNEFMYRPPDNYPRYVELYNRSGKLLSLRNWRLQRRQVSGESARFISEEDLGIEPESYLVITDDMELFNSVYSGRNVIELPSYPGFTVTTTDQIRLFTPDGVLADSLAYTPSTWGGNGVALERLSPDVASEFRENWAESPNPLFGTPGLPNEVRADPQPPRIVHAGQFENLGFRLIFDKRLDAASALNRENYHIEPPLNISMIGFDETEVLLFMDGNLESDQVYTLTVTGIKSLFGNEMEPAEVQIRYLEFGTVQPGELVINEILYRRLSAGNPEFIEIFNRSDKHADLSGWFLNDEAGSAVIPGGVAIRADDYLVFTDEPAFASTSEKIIYLPGFQPLGNNGDAVVLKNVHETVIDSVYYRPEWGNNTPGISLERKDPAALSIDPGNWAASADDRGSTPAEKNSRFEPNITPPEIRFANLVHPDSIEVIFDSFIHLNANMNTESRIVAGPSENRAEQNLGTRFLLNGSETDILVYNPLQANRIVLSSAGVATGEEITLTVENLADFQGNMAASVVHPVAQPLVQGHLVINEIMFNPLADSHDGIQDQSDYIEIYNRMAHAVSLEGIYLHDTPDENGNAARLEPVSSTLKWIPANGYALFYPEPDPVAFEASRTARFFNLSGEYAPFAMQTIRTTLSLPNAGREVYLADSLGTVIDMVNYSGSWHNPNIIDTRGISLERINPHLDSNNPSNWGSHTSPLGGSPGAENSLFQASGFTSSDIGVTLSPNPFSPDDDGFDDHLLIHYKLDEPDYLLRVRIFDRYGRLVRKLEDGKPAGPEGTLIWNGRNDNGAKNRIGIYIVWVEAYNSTTGKNRAFKETAVIARKF